VLNPDSPYVAYCPPGALDDARETLDRGGHDYRELDEHPVLAGTEQIILIDASVTLEPASLPMEPYWWEAAFMKDRLAGPVIVPPAPIISGSLN